MRIFNRDPEKIMAEGEADMASSFPGGLAVLDMEVPHSSRTSG